MPTPITDRNVENKLKVAFLPNFVTAPGVLVVVIDDYFLFSDGQWQYSSEYSTPPTEIDQRVYGKLTWHF
jgi:hypothetical protein